MFNRKFSSNIRLKRRMIRSTIILLIVCLGLGYSAFSTNLGINGTLNVSKYDHTLYGVLEKASKEGYAREYAKTHHDSFTVEPSKKIYYWNRIVNSSITGDVKQMVNVIFANHCWQMIRTTDTGGVKMIYNGEPENGQCLSTRGTHVGYTSRTTQSMSSSYYYGTSYIFDKNNNVFSLDGTVTTGSIKQGQYTCRSSSSTGTCATLYLVDTLNSGTSYYVLPLKNNSHFSIFGELQYNYRTDYYQASSQAYIGYMYNKAYMNTSRSQYYSMISNKYINGNNYYSDTIDYGNINADCYTLVNPQSVSNLSDYNELVGKYIITNVVGSFGSEALYITSVNGTTAYGKLLINGDLNTSFMIGDSYVDNGNGTYTINNPTSVSYIDLVNGSYTISKDKYICYGTSATCTNIHYIVYRQGDTSYNYWSPEETYKYSSSVTYNNGVYTLSGDIKNIWNVFDSSNQTTLSTHHYTCFSTGTTCSTINYVESVGLSGQIYSISINDANNISDALTNMLSADDVNHINSTIKTGVDAWYKRYLNDYTNKIEDTIYCNDRSIYSLGSYNPNGGLINGNTEDISLQFSNAIGNADLSCPNVTDKFSLTNNKAQLTYPVGILTLPERRLMNELSASGAKYYLMTPNYSTYSFGVGSTGGDYLLTWFNSGGVRPVISLKPGTEYASGSGSMADPYVVQ